MGYTIYALKTKKQGIRYIGQTKQSLKKRLKIHIKDSKRSDLKPNHRLKWVAKNKENILIISLIKDVKTLSEANAYEIHLISLFSFKNLINSTIGGDGTQGVEPWNKGKKCNYIDSIINGCTTAKAVFQYDLDGNFIRKFRSLKYAEAITGVARQNIKEVCNKQRGQKQCSGFIWKWKTDKFEVKIATFIKRNRTGDKCRHDKTTLKNKAIAEKMISEGATKKEVAKKIGIAYTYFTHIFKHDLWAD